MKKIIFEVSLQKECSVASLLKEVNKISCRISLNFKNGIVEVQDVEENMIDNVIDLINNYYTIEKVHIDNLTETAEANNNHSVEKAKELTESDEDTEIEVMEAPTESVQQNKEVQEETLTVQVGEDFSSMKVEFPNEYVKDVMYKLLKTAYWLVCQKNIPENEFGRHVYTCINELSMWYGYKERIDYAVGDIVECNYGVHLVGEINGSSVSAIVCEIAQSGMVYLVPITKPKNDILSSSHLIASIPEDVIYEDEEPWGGDTVILKKGKYVNSARINRVIGKTNSKFFEKVLELLANGTFDFRTQSSVIAEEQNTDTNENLNVEPMEEKIISEEDANASEEVVEESTKTNAKSSMPKYGKEEEAILEIVGIALSKLDKDKPASEQVEDFMEAIGIKCTSTTKLVKQAFEVACVFRKINYENIVRALKSSNPNIKEEIIKASLKENFKNWLNQHPELAEKYPKISIMALLKVFAKKFMEDANC